MEKEIENEAHTQQGKHKMRTDVREEGLGGRQSLPLPLARNVTLIASGNRTRLATDTYSDSRIRTLVSASAAALDEDEAALLCAEVPAKTHKMRGREGRGGDGLRGNGETHLSYLASTCSCRNPPTWPWLSAACWCASSAP